MEGRNWIKILTAFTFTEWIIADSSFYYTCPTTHVPTVNMNYFCNKKHIILYRAAGLNPNKVCYLTSSSYLLKYGFKKL